MIQTKSNFKNLIPPLTKEEEKGLEDSIKVEGCRDALVLWNDFIIDGHNRFKICNKHKISYKTISKKFKNEDEVCLWIIKNQIARRNLNKSQLAFLGVDYKKYYSKLFPQGGARQVGISSNLKKSNADRAGKEVGVSGKYIDMAEEIIKKKPEKRKEIEDGDITISEVSKEIKQEERQEKVNKQIKEIESENVKKPKGNYDVIVIDPPWKVDFKYSPDHYMGRVANPYPEMTIKEIKNIKLPAKNDCILWLWTTQSQIWQIPEILEKWGFEYKCILTWNKEIMGIGKWLRKQTEFCIMATKGKPIWKGTDVRDILSEKRTKHSKKPESFYVMVDKNCIGKKLDYFARKKREGWDVYGDEVK